MDAIMIDIESLWRSKRSRDICMAWSAEGRPQHDGNLWKNINYTGGRKTDGTGIRKNKGI
jgi:hypothetical protein